MIAPWQCSSTISSVQSDCSTDPEIQLWPKAMQNAWLKALTRDDHSKLVRRLKWDNLDAKAILDWSEGKESDAEDGNAYVDSGWHPFLRDLQRDIKTSWDIPLLPHGSMPQIPFVDIWLPVLNWSREILAEHVNVLETDPGVDDSAYIDLGYGLIKRLSAICESALWSEFCKFRSFGSSLLAYLGADGTGFGEPVREKYKIFVESHRQNGLVDLLDDNPVLARHIGTVMLRWSESSKELLQRIILDRSQIESIFEIPKGARLKHIQQGLSDFHNGGRQVSILTFAEKLASDAFGSYQLVYKPRNMGLDAAFQDAVSDINSHSGLPPLKTLAVLNKGRYGYMEYVEHKTCAGNSELSRFYYNAGRITALLYLLCCTDCHHENFIAHGEHLILIDAETLFEPDLLDEETTANSGPREAPRWTPLQKQYQRSVLRTGLLPVWIFMGAERTPVDISALGIAIPSATQVRTRGWIGMNTDGMLFGTTNKDSHLPTSLPSAIGANTVFSDYVDIFCSGFQQQSEYLLGDRSRWLAPDGILSAFAGMQRRFVFRSTNVYLRIQRQQLGINALRSSFDQAMTIEQLARCFLIQEECPFNWPLFSAEVTQMNELDIPYFVHDTDGTCLHPAIGLPCPLPYFAKSGLENSRKTFKLLNRDIIDFQIRLVRGSCEAKQLRSINSTALRSGIDSKDSDFVSHSNIAGDPSLSNAAARRVAEYILLIAITDSSGCFEWLGMDLHKDGQTFGFGPVGSSLYGGSIGVACFFDCLLREGIKLKMPFELRKYSSRYIIESILSPVNEVSSTSSSGCLERWWRDQPLGLAGSGGILLALNSLDKQSLIDKLLLGLKPHLIDEDIHLDVVSGCAGLIGVLLLHGSDHSMHLANQAGMRLLATQCHDGTWRTRSPKSHALLGFSHGTAGFAACLARLYAVTGKEEYSLAAHRALDYERSKFSTEQMNWPDFRSAHPRYQSTWCHGAPGIALSRACLWGTSLFDEECTREINIALQTTALAVDHVSGNHLCCGNLGLAAIMRSIRTLPVSLSYHTQAACSEALARISSDAIHRGSSDKPDLICLGTDQGSLALPGFFNGLSGMGMALLESPKSQKRLAQVISAALLT
jgi:type 2 lantibiotic biosynthesis protein LanM